MFVLVDIHQDDPQAAGLPCPLRSSPVTHDELAVYAELMQPGDGAPSFLDLLRRPAWTARAACAGYPTEWFFPAPGRNRSRERANGAGALEVCEACPVRSECLDYATADDELIGIWGGTATPERRAIRAA